MRTHTGPKWSDTKKTYRVTINGRTYTLGRDREVAEAEYIRLKAAAASEVVGDREPIQNLLAKYLDEVQATKQPTTYALWRRVLKLFVGVEGTRPVCDLTPAHVTAFIATMRQPRSRRARGWGQGTAR